MFPTDVIQDATLGYYKRGDEMNLAVLERMARNGDMSKDAFVYLLSCRGECEWLDYKENLSFDNDKALCDFSRDALGIKNIGGGYIVVGVQDKTWKPVGLCTSFPYDTKLLRDQVMRATGVSLDIDVVSHEMKTPQSAGHFALILVRASRKRTKRRSPTVVGKDFCASTSFGLRRGEIYVRKGDSTVRITTQEELEDLLDNLEAQTEEATLTSDGQSSPFAIEDGLYRLLEPGFEHFVGRDEQRRDLMAAITKDPRIWIINVHGPGGVGKSALVNWVVYEYYKKRQPFESIIQLTAKDTVLTPQGIRRYGRSLYSLENLLDHILATFGEDTTGDLAQKKQMAIDYLSAWSTLLVLDNMETVQDARIVDFVQTLPVNSKAKILMTSRQKSGMWELPLYVKELTLEEIQTFLKVRVEELAINCPTDISMAKLFLQESGGLPLAIQWILGCYKKTGRLDATLHAVSEKDSPVLEFSFRNIWQVLTHDAKAILAVMTIFDDPPTQHQLTVATELPVERIEKACAELAEVTLIDRSPGSAGSATKFVALPITLSFARHQLNNMGEFEVTCRRRFMQFTEQMTLQESEIHRFRSRFERYGLQTDNEKRAAILCQRGESEVFSGNVDNADLLFNQARELAPQSAYVYAMSASNDLNRNRIGSALAHIEEACKRLTKQTGDLCYTVKARILDAQRDRYGRLEALSKALEYAPDDAVIRHQYGVALSRAGYTDDAVKQFTVIIDRECKKMPPSETLLMALRTRIINLIRLHKTDEAQADITFGQKLLNDYKYMQKSIRFDDLEE